MLWLFHTLCRYCFPIVRGGSWLGLNDVLRPNKHRWCWGFVAKPCHKFDWYSNEPVYHEHGDYNCGLFKRSYKYHWHVDSCGQKNHFVCEKPMVNIIAKFLLQAITLLPSIFFLNLWFKTYIKQFQNLWDFERTWILLKLQSLLIIIFISFTG